MSHSDAEIREGVVLENKIEPHIAYNPFNYVEPCEPDCTPERHAYHQGQWEMAQRICESFGVLPNPVDGHDIPINATKAILALIEELKEVRNSSAQNKDALQTNNKEEEV